METQEELQEFKQRKVKKQITLQGTRKADMAGCMTCFVLLSVFRAGSSDLTPFRFSN
jgi:hypothetical protein